MKNPMKAHPSGWIAPDEAEYGNEIPAGIEEAKIGLLIWGAAGRQLDHLGGERVQRRLLVEECVVLRVAEAEGEQCRKVRMGEFPD